MAERLVYSLRFVKKQTHFELGGTLPQVFVVQRQGAPKAWVCRIEDIVDYRCFRRFARLLHPWQQLRLATPTERPGAAEWRVCLADLEAQQLFLGTA